jgi:NitT/TauT family transport system substrate-binding protein
VGFEPGEGATFLHVVGSTRYRTWSARLENKSERRITVRESSNGQTGLMSNSLNKSGRHKIIGLVCLMFLSLVSLPSCSQTRGPEAGRPVTVAYAPFESTALLWVARDKRYFEENGLSVTLRKDDTGAASLSGVMNGEADIAVGMSEFPIVRTAFQKGMISIIGNADKGEFIYFVGRKDRGIERASDLKGKRVGTAVGTISEYFLGSFLELNGLTLNDIDLVDLNTPQEWVSAVVSGEIDAVVTAQPDAHTVLERLGVNGFSWSVQAGQFLHGLIVATDDWLDDHPELAEKFLESIAQAEQYAANNPEEAKAIVQKGLNLDAGYVNTVWRQNQFVLSLDQSLIAAMEDEARWMIGNDLTPERSVPNFLNFINADSIKRVKPGSVRISGK